MRKQRRKRRLLLAMEKGGKSEGLLHPAGATIATWRRARHGVDDTDNF
jgi:hypothetical protein